MLKEIWFWTGVIGIIFAGLVGFNWRFTTRKGKLRKRKDYDVEKTLETIVAIEFIIVTVETIWRMVTSRHSVVLNAFTDELFYEIILFSLMFIVIYVAILAVTIAVVDVAHIGLHQIMLEQDKADEEQAFEEFREWLEDYDRKLQQASVDSEYEDAMASCRAYELMNH